MKRSHWTFLYVPHGDGGVRTVNVQKKLVYAFGALAGIFVIAVGLVTFSFVRQQAVVRSVEQRDMEVVALRSRISELEDLVSDYERRMAENRILQERASLIAGLGPIDDEFGASFGRGGQEPYAEPSLAMVDEVSRDRIRELRIQLDRLLQQAEHERMSYEQVLDVLAADQDLRDGTPSIRPILGGYVSSRYGRRPDPFTGQVTFHRGIDFAARVGTPVIAPADGRVKRASRKGSLGLLLEIEHANGVTTRYGHLDGINVSKGDRVERGQVVARVGNTGRSTGPHLHYEVVQNGRSENPWLYIIRD